MKTRIILCFLFIAVFFTGQSLAKIADSDKDVKALTFFASEQSWPLLINGAIKSGSYIDCKSGKPSGKCVTFDFLTKGMYAHAKGNAHVMELVKPENRTESAYIKLTRSQNDMPETGGAIPLEDLRELVFNPDKGIVYAREVDPEIKTQVAQATKSVQADATPAITVRPLVKPLEASKPSEAEAQISNLKNQIAEMKKAFAGGNAEANKRLSALEKHLNELAKNVESVGKGQKDLAQNQAMISDSLAEIGNALLALKADFSNEIGRVETKMDYGFYEIYESVTYNQRVIFISLFGMIAILSLFFWFANRKTRRIANEAKDLADKANFKATNADNLAKQAGATVGSLEVEIDEILGTTNDETKGLCIHDQEKITPEKTAFLTIGSNTTVMVEFSGNAVEVIFERFTDDSFVVHGVKRNNDTEDQTCIIKRNTNFVRFLKKAYKDKRIIGTTSIKVNKAA